MVKRARISMFYATFIQDEWRWQSIWGRAGNAETVLRPPATTWWLPVGGWTVVVRGRRRWANAAGKECQTWRSAYTRYV